MKNADAARIMVMQWQKYLEKYLEYNRVSEAYEMAVKLLKQEGGWVPVSERLPVEKEYYLTTTVCRDVRCDFWNGEEFVSTEAVVAWQPMPEPYMEG